ncbi:MAG: ABC transporter ATP-binding protein [Planctomycetales bacterium]|nr:ABC transporter ATP-binding protein [Planctomycetales bacterium]
MPLLIAKSVSKSYPSTDHSSLEVLVDVSLGLAAGENLAIMGPSGSGKSTLLSILGTLECPTAGQVLIDGVDPFQLSESELAAFRSREIGFVFQDHHLLPQCTVLENVLVPFLADGRAGPVEVDRAKELLQRVGLAERSMHRPAQLSGGERQRAALARALVRNPKVLLADEPTGNLDSSTAESIGGLLLELQRETDAVLIVVTHSASLANKLQRQLLLEGSRLHEC